MGGIEVSMTSSECGLSGGPPIVLPLSTRLVDLLARGNLGVNISRAKIDDKSKANTVQKCLVLIQVCWMATQCIARKAIGLPLTLLEIHTMVHVICAVIMYIFWMKVFSFQVASVIDAGSH